MQKNDSNEMNKTPNSKKYQITPKLTQINPKMYFDHTQHYDEEEYAGQDPYKDKDGN